GVSTFASGAQGATNINYTLPTAAPVANTYALTSTTGGVMSWTQVPLGSGGGVSGLTTNGAVYAASATSLGTTAAMTNGQLLIGSTGVAPVLGTLTAGTGIS